MKTTKALEYSGAVLDSVHVGDIRGALGTIRLDDTAPRRGLSTKPSSGFTRVGSAVGWQKRSDDFQRRRAGGRGVGLFEVGHCLRRENHFLRRRALAHVR